MAEETKLITDWTRNSGVTIDIGEKVLQSEAELKEGLNKIGDAIGVNHIAAAKDNISNLSESLKDKLKGKIAEKFPNSSDKAKDFFKINNISFRDKLVLNCPDFMNMCNINKIDFGKLFLSPDQEKLIESATGLANDAINIANGIQQYISMDTVYAAIDVVTFIIQDVVTTILQYAQNIFETYITPSFPLGLMGDLTQKSLKYTQANTKDPAKILEELMLDPTVKIELESELEKVKQQLAIGEVIGEKFAKVQSEIQRIMDEIEPYSSEIAKYALYGPDYACTQLEMLYNKYFGICISFVDEQLAELNRIIDSFIDNGAESLGKFLAEKINSFQERQLRKVIDTTNTKMQKAQIKAIALINKAVMNLMAMLGG